MIRNKQGMLKHMNDTIKDCLIKITESNDLQTRKYYVNVINNYMSNRIDLLKSINNIK